MCDRSVIPPCLARTGTRRHMRGHAQTQFVTNVPGTLTAQSGTRQARAGTECTINSARYLTQMQSITNTGIVTAWPCWACAGVSTAQSTRGARMCLSWRSPQLAPAAASGGWWRARAGTRRNPAADEPLQRVPQRGLLARRCSTAPPARTAVVNSHSATAALALLRGVLRMLLLQLVPPRAVSAACRASRAAAWAVRRQAGAR